MTEARISGRGKGMPAPALSADEIAKLLHAEFPQAFFPGCGHTIERVAYGDVCVRWKFDESSLRPGGTVSGPTIMELADFAMYVAVFSAIGPQPLAGTTHLNINFRRKPTRADLIADARLMKVGKRLAVGEVTIRSEGAEEPVARWHPTHFTPSRHC